MADPIRHVSLRLPLRIADNGASVRLVDADGRTMVLYVDDDDLRRSVAPWHWRTADGRALAVWIARKLTDAIESGELVAVDRVEMQGSGSGS